MQSLEEPRAIQHLSPSGLAADAPQRLVSHEYPVHEAVRPLLVELSYLRSRGQMPPGDVLFTHARSELNRLRAKLEELALPPDDVRDIYYALVAFIDEMMQADSGPLKDFWEAHLLQLELFGETHAGEGFFDRLNEALDARRIAVVRVYYLCLLFGFQGIYAKHGELERENLIEEVREALGIPPEPTGPLAPFGARPDEPAANQERNRLLLWLSGTAAVLMVVGYIGIAFAVDARGRALSTVLAETAKSLIAGPALAEP